jgi:hypothetical protein
MAPNAIEVLGEAVDRYGDDPDPGVSSAAAIAEHLRTAFEERLKPVPSR